MALAIAAGSAGATAASSRPVTSPCHCSRRPETHDSAHVVSLAADGAPDLRSRRSAALRYSEAARVRLLRRLVVAQEEERRRIAADLHDHLGQQLTSLRLTFEALRRAAAPDSALASALTHADAILVQIDRDIDFLSWELRPAALDDLGLRAVLENYVDEWSRHTGVAARFHADGVSDDPLAPEIGAALYRIAQEALNNVARHARASSVSVLLERRGQTLTLTVEDNGVGFAPPDNTMTMIGVTGMRERAAVIGGVFDIEPTAGGGTTITAQVPLSLTDTIAARPTTWPSEGASDDGGPLVAPPGPASRIEELQHAVAARDEFIATVAHELRNPLAPLIIQVRLSLDKAEQIERAGELMPPEWARTQLRRIEGRLHRVLETLDRLLDVSRLSSGRIDLELDEIDLVESALEVLESFEAELAVARCRLTVTAPPSLVGWWDRLRLDQICRNLVSNAIRFGAGRPIEVVIANDDTTATLTIRDYGIGIPEQRLGVIFERFERGPEGNRSGGFGIGLWVVRNLCAAMGGTITVDSVVGVGSTFTVTLPRRLDRDNRREVHP